MIAVKKLLTRDQFREAVFNRDGHACVVCKEEAKDAHHIIERRLWPDGGYYLDNGASLCAKCHLEAEQTLIPTVLLWAKIGSSGILPPHFELGQPYDKWGNPVLHNGKRLRGELFDDPSVSKVLEPVRHVFTNRMKYPRTFHLPWSPGMTSDDRILESLAGFWEEEVVVTVKQDGENTSLYRDGLHARSIDSQTHPSRSLIKQLHAVIASDIPEGWRVCGENLTAKHSIHYKNLPTYFQVFSIWNGLDCLSWDDTVEWAKLLALDTVPVLYRGPWDERLIRGLYAKEFNGDPCEGYVVRVARGFRYRDFSTVVGKYVRTNHVDPNGSHWHSSAFIPNSGWEKK